MTLVRVLVTIFVLAILTATGFGWFWTAANQPPAGAMASRIVLGIAALAGVGALIAVWKPNGRHRRA
jgi:hypothetical protein